MKKLANYVPFVALLLLPLLIYPGAAASSWRSSSDVDAVLEFASSLLAITAGIMVLLHFFATGRRFFLAISIGLVLIGAEEFVRTIFSFERLWPQASSTLKLAISTTWLAGNFALAASLLTAIALGDSEIAPARRRSRAIVSNVVAFTAATFLSWLVFISPFPPTFVQLGSTAGRTIELSLALLLFVAFLLYANLYARRQSRSPLLWSIVAFIALRVVAHLLVFDARAFYDAHWDIAHVLVLLSYLFPIFGVWDETIELQRTAQARLVELGKEMTERRRLETSLQEARTMAERYLNVAAEVMLALDAQGNITLLNDSGHRLLGYAPGELIGKNWFDTCLPEEAKTEVRGVFARLMAGEGADVLTYESSVITRNGSRLALLWHNTLLRDADGRIVGTLSSGQDITERKQAEEEVQRERTFFNQLVETAPEGIAITDTQGRIIRVNAEFVRMFGYRVDETVGQDIDDLVAPSTFEEEAREVSASTY